MGAPGDVTRTVLVCGEVRTGLLPTFEPLDVRAAEQLLRLRADELVLVSKRPNLYVLSPETLTGVDCRLPTSNGAKVRAVGTVAARAALTEGRLLQADAYFRAPASGPDERRPWGHYLVRPGTVEPLGKLPQETAAQGALAGSGRGELDLGLIAENLLARLLRHKLVVHRTPMKSQYTRLRWVALPAADGEGASIERFTLAEDELRTVRLRVPEGVEPAAVAGLCEDLALHDWLLTTIVRLLDSSRPGPASRASKADEANEADAALALRPAVEHLLHLWMPGARVHHVLAPLWEVLEREPGFSRQWHTLVQRIRDQLAVQAIPLLRAALTPR
ncbi:SCO2521 family protein [Streptomyces sp. NPDC088747]|uniref:SCO2521 family protein n=1 Tax=Streptomyces sp. NPDC088747 TaxID=3365886 RepID=UPI00380C7340